jgi:TetR/AcrR family transcriptional regulator, regulator of cefoperazone and chloramphenicol sensitivity
MAVEIEHGCDARNGLTLIDRLIKYRSMSDTNTQPRPASGSPADLTRSALIQAALKLFGTQGYDGTSTREIAAAAKANIGSIAYHFGGKDGLRLACADFIVETIQKVAGEALKSVPAQPLNREAAMAQLSGALERMVMFIIASPEAGGVVQFVLRELAQPTAALDRIYLGVFEPVHRRLCAIWEAATGEPAESERTKITVFTVIGQVVYFRIARPAVLRRLGWTDIGPKEAAAVIAVAKDNLDAITASRTGGKS